LYLTPSVAVRDIGVDTNVYNDPDNPTKDFVFTVVPVITATSNSPRVGFNVSSTTDLVYFAEQRSERSVNEYVVGSARFPFRRIVPNVEASYLNTRDRLSPEIDARARRVEVHLEAGTDVIFTPKFRAFVTLDTLQTKFNDEGSVTDRALAEAFNRDEPRVSGGVRFILTPLTSISGSTDVTRIRFVESSVRDADSYQTQFGLDLNANALISGSARVGYQKFDLLSPTLEDYSGVIASGNLLYRLQTATSLGFTFDRSVSYSFLPLQPYYVRAGFGGLFRRQVVSNWELNVSAERFRHEYRSLLAPTTEDYSERVVEGTVSIGYGLGPRTRFTTGVTYSNRRSEELDARTYDGIRVGGSIYYTF
jgi:hypothetical protein